MWQSWIFSPPIGIQLAQEPCSTCWIAHEEDAWVDEVRVFKRGMNSLFILIDPGLGSTFWLDPKHPPRMWAIWMPLEVNLKPIKRLSLNVHEIHSQSGCGFLSQQNISQTFRTSYVGSASNRAVHLRIENVPSLMPQYTLHIGLLNTELWTHPSETTPTMNVDITKENQ